MPATLTAHDGCIVGVASAAGVRGGRRRVAYHAAAGARAQLTRRIGTAGESAGPGPA